MKTRTNTPIFLLAGILSLSILLLASCNQSSSDKGLIPSDVVKNPNTADGNGDASEMPVMSFEKDFHDFAVIRVKKSFGFNLPIPENLT
ncbi:MAG: hypothetical protein M9948_10335 [Lentimicrobium sp.]|nr:hypothetical protein [Lentimicrobium sp.]